jgi:hypothetical protein
VKVNVREADSAAGAAKKFDVLHQALVEYQQRIISTGLSGTGFILVVIGWLATSTNLHEFLRASPSARWGGALALLLALAAYLLLARRALRNMHDVKRRLDELKYLPESYYAFRLPPPWASTTLLMLNSMVALIALVLLALVAR